MSSAGDQEREQGADERATVMTTDDLVETQEASRPTADEFHGDVPDEAAGSAHVVDAENFEMTTAPPPWSRGAGQAGTPANSPAGPVSNTVQEPGQGVAQRRADVPAYGGGAAAPAPVEPQPEPPLVTGTAAPRVFGGQPEHTGGRTAVNIAAESTPPGTFGTATRGGAPTALRRPGRGPRRASLQVRRVDPWSVLKLALVLSVAMFFVGLVAVGVLYGVLDGMGVWDKLNSNYNDLVTSNASSGPLISAGRVFGIAAIIGAINIVLFTALATIGAFVYNVSADLAGGLEITLAERE